MKILKLRNGIALIAVMVIMLVTSLFIPVMFNLTDTSLRAAVIGTDRQRSSYFARTVTEMSVAAFKNFDSNEYTKINPSDTEAKARFEGLTDAEKAQLDKLVVAYNELKNHTRPHINTDRVFMYVKDTVGSEYFKVIKRNGVDIEIPISQSDYEKLLIEHEAMIEAMETPDFEVKEYTNRPIQIIDYATEGTDKYRTLEADSTYTRIGDGVCQITYDDSVQYFETDIATQKVKEITQSLYESQLSSLEGALATGATVSYSLSKKENKNLTFATTATVKGITTKRSCVLVLQTYPSDEDWFVFGIETNNSKIPSGGNQIFVDPSKASARIPIEYDQSIGDSYIKQTLLVYSAIGNMIIKPVAFKDTDGSPHSTGVNNSEFVLGVQPGLNTTPNDDPNYAIIDGVNYNSSTEVAQMNNFVAFTATNAIQVDLPVNLLVNPCRANRVGDGGTPNGSLFKVMIFQSPVIQFNGRLDMMMSFYVRGNEEARRMSSIVLAAPENTPYSYVNQERGKVVKAGKVFFTEDCYLWIIPYGEDGSASSWAGFLSETVYERDSDFTKIKIANAGDVYYFNADIAVDGERVGLSLTGYVLETEYIPRMEAYETGKWWQIWSNTKTAIFAKYMQGAFGEREQTYVKEDFKKIGNMNEDTIEYPEVEDYVTIWTS